ncbi:hypothetical protein M4Z80_23625, partial [Escherichia coli]|nr:hypothetical protein [Escherichia coli]
MERVGMDCRRRPIPCLPPRVASGHLDLNGSRRHLANGFTTPRIGANQFLRRTVGTVAKLAMRQPFVLFKGL